MCHFTGNASCDVVPTSSEADCNVDEMASDKASGDVTAFPSEAGRDWVGPFFNEVNADVVASIETVEDTFSWDVGSALVASSEAGFEMVTSVLKAGEGM